MDTLPVQKCRGPTGLGEEKKKRRRKRKKNLLEGEEGECGRVARDLRLVGCGGRSQRVAGAVPLFLSKQNPFLVFVLC
ncbi:MAG: hypothetical protein NEA02_03550 [Thermoanaerobaculia bacterium]|nr:hypothetical protein [Thermoanaerobaculia bacterium]